MEPEENEEVVREALANAPLVKRVARDEVAKSLAPHLIPGIDPQNLFDANGQFRTSPGVHRTDGFFAAVVEKTGATKP
jgi:16S rRNA C967 or C1407 C5-methylase (RsmB/RsmF family)